MRNSLGPWSTALNVGRNPQLSTFWKSRMAMLASASRSRRGLSRSAAWCLLLGWVVTCAVPTIRASSEPVEQPAEPPPQETAEPVGAEPPSPVPPEAAEADALKDFLDRVEAPKAPDKGRRTLHVRNAQGQIIRLRLKGVELQPGDCAVIGRLHRLETLDLSSTNVTDEDLRHLGGLVDLRELDLRKTGLSGSGLAHLGKLDRLETLDVAEAKLTEQSLWHLQQLEGLRRLDVGRNDIGDGGLAHLGKLRRLVALKLAETDVTDAGLRRLAGLKDLHAITLDGTKVSESGLNHLAGYPKLAWIASPLATAKEVVRRMESSEYEAANDMLTIGLPLPRRGEFRIQKLESLPPGEGDRQEPRRKFRMELHWKAEYDPLPEQPNASFPAFDGTFFSVFLVDRGAVRAIHNGIDKD